MRSGVAGSGPVPQTSRKLPRKVSPHFAASLRDIFFGDVNIQVGPESQQAAAGFVRAVLLSQEVGKIQYLLLLLRQQIMYFF